VSASPAQTDSGGGAVLAVPIANLDDRFSEHGDRAWWLGNFNGTGPGAAAKETAAAKESARAAADDPRSATARTLGCLIGRARQTLPAVSSARILNPDL